MKEIITDKSSIENVLDPGCVYVDKTAYLHKLVTAKKSLFFISRPRRFGKSLMLSTLKAIFEGRRELFEGTAISKTDYDWAKYPVLHLNMADAVGDSVAEVEIKLNALAMSAAKQFNFEIDLCDYPAHTFCEFWMEVERRNMEVVVLVDEYDAPVRQLLNSGESIDDLRIMMHDFYLKFKSKSGSIKFLMMTGETRFVNIRDFRGFNNLIDLSRDPDYAGMLGYTHEELEANFPEHIDAFAAKEGVTHQVIYDKLLEWYDNYRFSPDNDVQVLNPASVGLSLSEKTFKNYWISTGRASIVIEHLRAAGKLPSDLDRMSAFEDELDVCDAVTMPIKSFLYQSGYLTIDKADGELLQLKIPNEEVRSAIVNGHVNSILG